MSPQARPAAVPYDPGSGEVPPSLGAFLTDPDNPILLLVAAPSSDDAARAAIGLAEARARAGKDTVLVDAELESPRLHRLLDVPNLEGLADLFLFGASLRRVATRPETRHFEFVPAGAYAPEPSDVLNSSRWDRLAEEFSASRSLMLVFVPADASGAAALSRRVKRAVLIGSDRIAERAAGQLDPACQVLATIEPATSMSPGKLAAQAGPPPRGAATIFDEPDLAEPLVVRRPRRPRSGVPALLVLAGIAAVAAGALFLYRQYFVDNDAEAAMVAPVAESGPSERGRPVETPVPVSVAVEAHQDLSVAFERVASLRAAEPTLQFFVQPVADQGIVFFRVLAGPVADQDAGLTLLQRLVDAGHKTAYDTWAVKTTSRAFMLGDFEHADAAAAHVVALAAAGVPAYVVRIRHDTGAPTYRVYAGAYENESEAEAMEALLRNAGVEAELVTRTGEPIQ